MGMALREKESDSGNVPQDDESETEQTTRLNPPPVPSHGGVEEMELKKIPIKTNEYGYPEIVGTKSRCCKIERLKYALFGFNFILAILGFVVLVLAIWIRVDPEFWEYSTSLEINDFYKACYMFMIAGLVILIVSFFGCCGVLNDVQWMIITYMVISFLFFMIEVAAVILIWNAPYNKTIQTALENAIGERVKQRENDESARFFTDFIQAHLECCGAVTAKEYDGSAPASCQSTVSGNVFDRGCASVMLQYLRTKAGIVGGIALPILLFHLLSIIVAFCVLLDIRTESRYSI